MRFPAELTVTIPRRWAWALGIAVAVLVGLLVWLLLLAHGAAPAVAETARNGAAPAERRVMGPVPPRVTTTAPPARAVSGETARGIEQYEICGGTWVKANPDGNVDDEALKGPMRRDEAAQAVDRALAADPRPMAQAARLILEIMNGGDDQRRALMASGADCSASGACPPGPAVPAAAVSAMAASREALARSALTTTDPAVYALAFRVCASGGVRDGACALLNAEQWARLDPGNAAPWQEVFAAAQARRDSAAANEALHRIATSQRSEQRFFDLPGLFIDVAPDDDGLRNGVFLLVIEAIGLQSTVSLPSYAPFASVCRREALRDSNRRQTCDSIAELLAQKSDTLVERAMGEAVGRQLGWPQERIERMRAEQDAFITSTYAGIEPRNAMGCDAIRRVTDDVRRKARLGEVGAMRDWLAHDAPPADELLRRYRDEQRERGKAAAASAAGQAASAASAPG